MSYYLESDEAVDVKDHIGDHTPVFDAEPERFDEMEKRGLERYWEGGRLRFRRIKPKQ